MFGYDHKEKDYNSFYKSRIKEKDRERVDKSLRKALANPKVKKWKEDYSFLRSDGIVSHVSDRGFIIRNQDGEAVRMVGAMLDVTASKKLFRETKLLSATSR